MIVTAGSTDVTTYFRLVDPASGLGVNVAIANLTLVYWRDRASGQSHVAEVLAGEAAAHLDWGVIAVWTPYDETIGLYRVDWPDEAFAAGVDHVQLCVYDDTGGDQCLPVVMCVDLREAGGLDDEVWTDARAGKLDNLNAEVSSRLATGADGDTGETLSDQLDAVKVKTDLIGSSTVVYNGPGARGGSFSVVAGDAYLAAKGTNLSWTITDYSGPSLAGSTGKLRLLAASTYRNDATAAAELEVTATIAQDDTTVTITADLTAVQTAALTTSPPAQERNYAFEIVATLAGTGTHRPLRGFGTVLRGIGAPA